LGSFSETFEENTKLTAKNLPLFKSICYSGAFSKLHLKGFFLEDSASKAIFESQ
jgi:hypothetical protein